MSSEIHFAGEMRIPALRYYPRRDALAELKVKLGEISWEDPEAGVGELERYVGYVETERLRDGEFSVVVETYREQVHAVSFVVEHPLVALFQDFGGPVLSGEHLDHVQALPRVLSVTLPWSSIAAITSEGISSPVDTQGLAQALADNGVPGFPASVLAGMPNHYPGNQIPLGSIPAGYIGSHPLGFPFPSTPPDA